MAIPGNLLNATTEAVDPSTAGWSAVLNCAKTLGTGGRNGDGTLLITSAASGEMQARTTSTVPVTVSETYLAFADAMSTTQAERIGIRWLTAAMAEISITWSLTTAASSASWHRISVAAAAPATAARAQVVLSATAGASSRLHHFENVYLGPPIRTLGNLFPYQVESGGEIDSSGWTAETNATVGRSVPAVPWEVDTYVAGGHVITATAVAGGNAVIRTTDMASVVPGTDYIGYVYLGPPNGTLDCWIELRWYDADEVLIDEVRAYLDQPGTGYYRQRVSGIAPAGAAWCQLAAGMDSASAAQVLTVEGVVVAQAPELLAGTVLPYEDASFEQGAGAWTVASGAATIARSSPWGTPAFDGSYALAASSATATTSVLRSGRYALTAGAAGQSWRPQVTAYHLTGGWTVDVGVRWYDETDTEISFTDFLDPFALPADSSWWSVSNDFVAPAGAVSAEVEVELVATTTSSTLRLDRVTLRQVLPLDEVEADEALGRMRITMRELTAGWLATLWRVAPDGSRTFVRGPSGLMDRVELTSDVLILDDYEAPLDTPVSYELLMYDADTGDYMGERTTDTVTMPVPDRSLMWIKDPAQPQRNVRVQAVTAPDWERAIEETEHRVRGRRNSVVLSDVRGGRAGEAVVRTRTDDERKALDFALDPGHVMLLQWAPGLGEDDIYVKVGQATAARAQPYGGDPRRLWTLPLKQQDMPITGLAGTAGWTVQDVATEYATVQAVVDAYATVLDLALNQRIGG